MLRNNRKPRITLSLFTAELPQQLLKGSYDRLEVIPGKDDQFVIVDYFVDGPLFSALCCSDLTPGFLQGGYRRHLEYVASDLADELGAKVTYKADGGYDMGELLSAVIGRQGELLKLAAKAARSWGDEEQVAQPLRDIAQHLMRIMTDRTSYTEVLITRPGQVPNSPHAVRIAEQSASLSATSRGSPANRVPIWLVTYA